MKIIILLSLLFIGCTKKYETYHAIDKYNFNKDKNEAPISGKLLPVRKVTRERCTGQLLFFSNAKKEMDSYVNNIVKDICPDSKYLVNNRITEIWWTTIIYSRSCVELEAYCAKEQKN